MDYCSWTAIACFSSTAMDFDGNGAMTLHGTDITLPLDCYVR